MALGLERVDVYRLAIRYAAGGAGDDPDSDSDWDEIKLPI